MDSEQTYKYHHNSLGISLLELMLALIIISTIIFSGIRFFRVARESERVTAAVSQVRQVAKASYQWLAGNTDFSSVSIQALVSAGLLPTNFSDGTKANPWSGIISVSASSANPQQIQIELDSLPAASCESLKEKLANSGTGCCVSAVTTCDKAGSSACSDTSSSCIYLGVF